MEKFQDFSVAQILCEINFVECRSAKTAVFAHLEALNLSSFWKFQPSNVHKFIKIIKLLSPKNGKNWQLELLNSPNWFHIKSERQKNQEISSVTNRSNFYSKVAKAKVEKPQFCQHCSSFCAHARFLNISKCLSARFLNINKSVYLGRLSVLWNVARRHRIWLTGKNLPASFRTL